LARADHPCAVRGWRAVSAQHVAAVGPAAALERLAPTYFEFASAYPFGGENTESCTASTLCDFTSDVNEKIGFEPVSSDLLLENRSVTLDIRLFEPPLLDELSAALSAAHASPLRSHVSCVSTG